ncbi:MAG: hypothetical protein AAFW73_27080, partial [Bacteroidota bacterium]
MSPRLEETSHVDDPRSNLDFDNEYSDDDDADDVDGMHSVPVSVEDPIDHTPDVGTLRRLHSYVARRWPQYYQPGCEERVVSEMDEVLGLEPKYRQPFLSFCSSLRRSTKVVEKIVADRKTARRVPFRSFMSSYSVKNTRKFYATGVSPSFKAQASFETIADPARRRVVHRQNVFYTQMETERFLRTMHSGIETSSFVGWHLASMGSRMKETLERLPSMSADELRASMVETIKFLQCMDKANSSSLHLQNVNAANVILRKRQSFVNLCAPSVSVADKAELLYSPPQFGDLFNREVI